jgi:hypothetical protein
MLGVLSTEMEGWNIVLLGNFNPTIFQPLWFAKHGLIGETEAQAAEVQIIRPELTIFKTGIFSINVTLERFQIDTVTAQAAEPIRDLVIGTFKVLQETPVAQMGINRHQHFKMGSVDDWHTVGHKVAPKTVWKDLIDNPGTRNLSIQGTLKDTSSKYVVFTLQPSTLVQPGVYVGMNAHYERPEGASIFWLLETLNREWAPVQLKAKTVAQTVISRCLE